MNRRWAEGIQPQKLMEVVEGFFVSEEIGGFGKNYRMVRRDVEIAWVKRENFDLIISLLPTPQNLQNYKKSGIQSLHFPITENVGGERLLKLFELLQVQLAKGQKLLMHRYRRTDFVAGVLVGFMLATNRARNESEAVLYVENKQGKKLGEEGQHLVRLVGEALEARVVKSNDGGGDDEHGDGKNNVANSKSGISENGSHIKLIKTTPSQKTKDKKSSSQREGRAKKITNSKNSKVSNAKTKNKSKNPKSTSAKKATTKTSNAKTSKNAKKVVAKKPARKQNTPSSKAKTRTASKKVASKKVAPKKRAASAPRK